MQAEHSRSGEQGAAGPKTEGPGLPARLPGLLRVALQVALKACLPVDDLVCMALG